MKMQVVIPIADSQETFDVRKFRNVIHQTLGIDLSTDEKDISEPINVLAKLLQSESNAQQHIIKTFLILIPTMNMETLFNFQNIKMSVTTDGMKTVVIATGNVNDWCNVILEQSKQETASCVLLILNQLQHYLELSGVKQPFKEYNRVRTRDENFYLE